jgi:hypothetical protein
MAVRVLPVLIPVVGLLYMLLAHLMLPESTTRTKVMSRCSQATVLLSLFINVATDLRRIRSSRVGVLAGPLSGAVAASVSFGLWPLLGVCTILAWSLFSACLPQRSK